MQTLSRECLVANRKSLRSPLVSCDPLAGVGASDVVVLERPCQRNASRHFTPAETVVRAELRAMKENRPFLVLWSVFLFQNLAVGANATIQIYLVIFVMQIDKGLIGVMIAASAAAAKRTDMNILPLVAWS